MTQISYNPTTLGARLNKRRNQPGNLMFNSRTILLPLVPHPYRRHRLPVHMPRIPPRLPTDALLAAHSGKQVAVFAGGCFWGQQAVFERVKGVLDTTAGYDGGTAATATYDQVTTETTQHAESVKVVFDPAKISYGTLLRIFFSVHDPTTLNRQDRDVGTSYRSAIFYQNDEQRRIAEAYIAQLNAAKVFPHAIVTQVKAGQGLLRRRELPPGLRAAQP